MALIDLPEDVVLHICSFLSVHELLRVRKTCKCLLAISTLRHVWHNAIHTYVILRGLPIPGLRHRDLCSLTAAELEACTLRALQLHRNWRLPHPQPTSVRPIVPHGDGKHFNLGLIFYAHYLLSATATNPRETSHLGRRWLVQCWDVSAPDTPCVAEMGFDSMVSMRANSDPASPYALALACRTSETGSAARTAVFALRPGAFHELFALDGYHLPQCLRGPRLVTATADNLVHVWDLDARAQLFVLDPPDAAELPLKPCLAVILQDAYILLFRQNSVEIYVFGDETHVPLTSTYVLPWRISSLVAGQRHAPAGPTAPPIDLFLRFDSWYPWPVNMLHHFHLRPSAPGAAAPYSPTPHATASWASAINLFTPADMALGPRGTALWIDSAESAGGDGQRIAARVLRIPESEAEARERALEALSNTVVAQGGNVHHHGEVPESTGDTVFLQDQAAVWNRIAMDEEEGRVAVGFTDGRIMLYEYAQG